MNIYFNEIGEFKTGEKFCKFIFEEFKTWVNEENNKRLTKNGKIACFYANENIEDIERFHLNFGDYQLMFGLNDILLKKLTTSYNNHKIYDDLFLELEELLEKCFKYLYDNVQELNLRITIKPTGGTSKEYVLVRN